MVWRFLRWLRLLDRYGPAAAWITWRECDGDALVGDDFAGDSWSWFNRRKPKQHQKTILYHCIKINTQSTIQPNLKKQETYSLHQPTDRITITTRGRLNITFGWFTSRSSWCFNTKCKVPWYSTCRSSAVDWKDFQVAVLQDSQQMIFQSWVILQKTSPRDRRLQPRYTWKFNVSFYFTDCI